MVPTGARQVHHPSSFGHRDTYVENAEAICTADLWSQPMSLGKLVRYSSFEGSIAMPYDPRRLNEDRTPPPARDRADDLGRIDHGIRVAASENGTCFYCDKPYASGEEVVSSVRNMVSAGF